MAPLTEDRIREVLQTIKFPGFSRDIVSFGIVKSIAITGDNDVTVAINVASREAAVPAQIEREATAALRQCAGIGQVTVRITATPTDAPVTPGIPGVKTIIAVASGKGGVGKSTVAVNLVVALHQLGRRVGLMDADIYGPSVPKMLGATERPTVTDDKLDPVEKFGIKMMSMALLIDADAPVIWRGPMIMKAIQQFSHAVNWGTLDVLVVDLPPGTGDAQLSLVQTIALDGGVIVTTPQDVALDVARRGMQMFEKVNVRILGLIENMSYYVCPHCRQRDDVFGHGGGGQEATRRGVPLLGEIPLFTGIRECGDNGMPIVLAAPESEPAQAFRHCAEAVWRQVTGS
ncbi:MAG: Mrp/NBP35 family ATP-binding protein [Verrucomicrobiota bacterium]|jgi:ATP-binding protein involved in chromosome partitioning